MSGHFPNLGPAIHRRAAGFGVKDLDASVDAFIAEVKIKPPPLLLEALFLGRIPNSRGSGVPGGFKREAA